MTTHGAAPTFQPVNDAVESEPGPIGSWAALTFALAIRALVRPRLALDLCRTAWAFRRRGWWHRFPFLPLPARDYLRWRMHTAYGDYDAVPPADDVIRFARWAVTKP